MRNTARPEDLKPGLGSLHLVTGPANWVALDSGLFISDRALPSQPQFTITPALLGRVEVITALRERIQSAAVQVAWIPALQKEDRPRYYGALQAVREQEEDLTSWLEYSAEGLQQTLERVWRRIQQFTASKSRAKLVLRPKQEQLLQLLRARGAMAPAEIWEALAVSKQGAMDSLHPLMKAGLIKRVGTLKHGRYILEYTRQQLDRV